MVQNVTMGEADFNEFMRLRNQPGLAAENFAGGEKLSPVLIPALSKDMVERLKLAHKVVDVVDRANKKTCVTLLRYIVDKPNNSYAQVPSFEGKKEDENFQRIVYVKYELGDFIYLLDVMNSVYD